jgi:hypothetical protein
MRIFLIFSALALSACAAAVQLGPASPDPNPTVFGEGEVPSNEILVYRAGQVGLVTNVATSPAILLDGRSIGTCRIGQPILIRVPSGTWTITALSANGQVSQEVTVSENERKNLRCGTSDVPALSPSPILIPVETEVAFEEAGL